MKLNGSPLWLGLQVAGVATAGGLALGIWLSYRLATRQGTVQKAALGGFALLSAMPALIVAWLLLRPSFPWVAGAAAGVLAAVPVVVLGTRRRIHDLNGEFGNAARSLGCSEWRIFWRVVLPLGWRAVLGAAAVAFMRVWVEWSIVTAL
jgi:molybdate transport system permease protein